VEARRPHINLHR